jgi:2-hydroxy-3-keto-5-methylthiopentenyl-1-phosphate phosphatase
VKGRHLDYTVQVDFDDTITVGIVSLSLMKAFSDSKQWELIEANYSSGLISVEESNRQLFAHINTDSQKIRDYVTRVAKIRPGFLSFVEFCSTSNINLVIVSSGLDIYIKPILQKLGLSNLELRSGVTSYTSQGIAVTYIGPNGEEILEGFKLAWFHYYRNYGRSLVYIGDSESDLPSALEADHVIARSELKELLASRGIPHNSFDTFYDVQKHLLALPKFHKLT